MGKRRCRNSSFLKMAVWIIAFIGSTYGTLGDLLYDLEKEPQQLQPIEDEAVKARLTALQIKLMKENVAPAEQSVRLGL